MQWSMRTLQALAVTTALFATSGCYLEVVDDGPSYPSFTRGDLTLRYAFDGRTCQQAGVDRIALRLDGTRTSEVYRDNVACDAFVHGITIEDLREDTYQVSIEARDTYGTLLYSLASARQVEVIAGVHQEYDVALSSPGGTLTVYWTFDGFGGCGTVHQLRVQLVDPDGFIFDDADYSCDFGGVSYDGLSEGLWNLRLDGIAMDGRVLFRSEPRNLVVIRGANNDYTVDLSSYR